MLLPVKGVPLIVSPPQNIQVSVRESFNLTCTIIGQPVPNITWTKDAIPLTSDGHITVGVNTIIISDSNVNDTGVYTCTGINTVGVSSYAVNVIVSEVKGTSLHNYVLFIFVYFSIAIICNNAIFQISTSY